MKNAEKITIFLSFVVAGFFFLVSLLSLFFALPITQNADCINGIVIPEFKKQTQWFAMISLMFAVLEAVIWVAFSVAKKNNQKRARISVCLVGLYSIAFLTSGYTHEEVDRLEKTIIAKYELVDDRDSKFSEKNIKKYLEGKCSFPASQFFLVCGYNNKKFEWYGEILHKFYIKKELFEEKTGGQEK